MFSVRIQKPYRSSDWDFRVYLHIYFQNLNLFCCILLFWEFSDKLVYTKNEGQHRRPESRSDLWFSFMYLYVEKCLLRCTSCTSVLTLYYWGEVAVKAVHLASCLTLGRKCPKNIPASPSAVLVCYLKCSELSDHDLFHFPVWNDQEIKSQLWEIVKDRKRWGLTVIISVMKISISGRAVARAYGSGEEGGNFHSYWIIATLRLSWKLSRLQNVCWAWRQ